MCVLRLMTTSPVLWWTAVVAWTAVYADSLGITRESYSQNPICRQNHCINPLFPGLHDLPRLEQLTWQCTKQDSKQYMTFCKDAVLYEPALPSPNSTGAALNLLIKAQDDAASTMFFYHMSGMGYEAFENQEPHLSADPCVKATWQMVCYTYFPRAAAGCATGEPVPYKRPCKSGCLDYLQSCQVECCDESPQCVFDHSVELGNGQSFLQTGYVDRLAPSAECTGLQLQSSSTKMAVPLRLILTLLGLQLAFLGGSSSTASARKPEVSKPMSKMLLAVVVGVMALCLQGCEGEIPRHDIGNWRGKPDYLVSYEYVQPGGSAQQATLNSCGQDLKLAATQQCSGRGYCRAWNKQDGNSISFCSCDSGWADPECRTPRKSQTKAFLLALLGGPLGLDYFYLGFPLWGLAKLLTLGGFGSWWLADIVRTGSGAVYAQDYRVAPDLPHWIFVVSVTGLFLFIGFLVSFESYFRFRKKKRADLLKLKESEESRKLTDPKQLNRLSPQYDPAAETKSFGRHPRPDGFVDGPRKFADTYGAVAG